MADTPNAPSYTTPQTFCTTSRRIVWALSGVSTGRAVNLADWRDRAVQVNDMNGTGAWGSATCVFEGCLFENGDPDHADHANAVFTTLTDTTETAISATDDYAVTQVLQAPVFWARPRTSGGTNTNLRFALSLGK